MSLDQHARLPSRLAPMLAAGLAFMACSGAATAAPIAFDRSDLQASASLQVSVAGVTEGGPLPANYTFDGRNLSPPLSWSAGPPQTRSFAVVMQDADAAGDGARQGLHWLVYSIPASVLTLPRGMHNVASPSSPLGARQGLNSHDSLGYTGPRLAAGEPAHHYHLQVFALDRPLRVRPGAELAPVLKAMAGHVVARGELVATYAAPAPDAGHGRQKGAAAPPQPAS